MANLTDRERRALQTICETLVPSLPSATDPVSAYAPAQADLVSRVEEALERVAGPEEQRELRLLLNAFEVGPFNGLTGGAWGPLSQLSQTQREALLARWANSRFFVQRKAFQSLKRLILFLAYSNLPDDQPNPIWEQIDYPGPPGGGRAERAITPLTVRAGQTLTTDVLVIGSGAGGGVVAGELSVAGHEVLIVEKGDYHSEGDFDGNERTANEKLYEKYGALASEDASIMILAGSTLGGGTVVNWAASLRPPTHVLEEWRRDYGFSAATSADFQASLSAVSERIGVGTAESHVNANNRVFEAGCQALSYHCDVIPRNVRGCEDCGWCGFGCSFGAKQSTLKTYLQDAHTRGARVVVRAEVRRILHSGGRVRGAEVIVTQPDGREDMFTIQARVVVVSAGAIHTPALLLRSGLTNPHIGQNLRLHPTTAIYGIFPEAIHTWRGVPMSRVSKEFSDLDGRGYGVTLEVAPTHPGLYALAFPWRNAREHKSLIANMSRMANVIAITRDAYGGSVGLDRRGAPVVRYRLHPYDHQHLLKGVLAGLRIHQAAGAERIFSPHNDVLIHENNSGGNGHAFEAYLQEVAARGLEPNAFPLFSAHQMASCRIGGSPALGAIDPTGQTYEVRGLYVADGSSLPTASGVNPMITIMGTSHYISQHIKAVM